MASSRRTDYGEEFVERLRRDRFRKAYILINGVSSEEEDEELCFDEEDDEMASYAMDPVPRPSSTHSSRRPPSIAASASYSRTSVGGAGNIFDARDLYFFGVVSEITDKLTPERAARLVSRNQPPQEIRNLASVERIAYLFYYSLYGRYLNVGKFHNVFNREFYKYTSAGDSERVAFLKICRRTLDEYNRHVIEQNKRAYKLSQKHQFSDERATPDSRMSDRPSVESEDINSIDSLAKELLFYRSPHCPIRFARNGRIVYVDPDNGMSTVCIEDVKKFYKDPEGRRYVEMLESFKGPMIVGHTPPQTPLLFIQCQIDKILQSDVYRMNPQSGDANDCLLIWRLLEMLIRQHGRVTGPDLARLLCANQENLSFSKQTFLKSANPIRGKSQIVRQDSGDEDTGKEQEGIAIEKVTCFLLGGHIEEAVETAMKEGLLFEALLLAHRLFRGDQRKLDAIEARLMAHRSPQHPMTTLLSVAADQPVPLLTNPTTNDTNGWRSHIAIVLANLQTPTAMNAVYHLGLALAQKEFNSAADFCFLAVNLLTGYDCFLPPRESNEQTTQRKHVRLINASLPDDDLNSCSTRFGWSLLDYQATELYDYATRLANSQNGLLHARDFILAREQYTQLLSELGGFSYAIELYQGLIEGKTAGYPTSETPSPHFHSSVTPVASVQPTHFASQQQPHGQSTRTISPETVVPSFVSSAQHAPVPTFHHQQQQQGGWTAAVSKPYSIPADTSLPALQSHSPPKSAAFSAQMHDPNKQPQLHQQTVSNPSTARTPSPPGTASTFAGYPEFPPAIPQPTIVPARNPPQNTQRTISESENDGNSGEMTFAKSSTTAPVTFPNPPFFMPPAPNMQPSDPAQFEALQEVNSVSVVDDRRTSVSSVKNSRSATLESVPRSNNSKSAAPSFPANPQPQQQEKTKPVEAKDAGTKGSNGGGGGGFLRGFLSKIKPPAGNEMRLPKDNEPKIVWDPQLGRYVDQEQKDQPVEELAPPPIMPVAVAPQQQQQGLAEPQEHHQSESPAFQPPVPMFPQIHPASSSGRESTRPFQGKARYANAWNS